MASFFTIIDKKKKKKNPFIFSPIIFSQLTMKGRQYLKPIIQKNFSIK